MSEIHKKAKRHAIDHYGNLIYPMEPRYDPHFKHYTVNLNAHIPRLIINDATQKRTINTLTLEKICKLTYNTDGNIQTQPTKQDCLQALNDAMNLWNQRINRIVTRASSDQLATVPAVHHFLHPAVVITNWLYHHNILTEENLENITRTEKYWDYIDLLKNLKVIAYGEDRFGLGKIGQGIREKSKTKDEFIQNTLSLILRERYSYLEEVMHIRVLSALLRTNTTYYRFCIEAKQNIEKHPKSIHHEYEKIYGRRSYVEFFNSLMELNRGNVIHYSEPYVTANEEILQKINDKEITPTVTPPN
jgi:hypothetical protein